MRLPPLQGRWVLVVAQVCDHCGEPVLEPSFGGTGGRARVHVDCLARATLDGEKLLRYFAVKEGIEWSF